MSAVLGWDAYGLTAVTLFLKMFIVILARGRVRIRNRSYVHLEDAAFFGRGPSPVAEDDTMRDRLKEERLEELSRLGQQVLESQPFSALVGTRLASLTNGEAVLEVPIRDALLQQNGYVHGGVIGYVADNALTFAGGSVLGPTVLTSEYKINYLRPASGEMLVARASVVYAGERQAVCRCDVFAVDTDGGETFCAAAQGTISFVAAPRGRDERRASTGLRARPGRPLGWKFAAPGFGNHRDYARRVRYLSLRRSVVFRGPVRRDVTNACPRTVPEA